MKTSFLLPCLAALLCSGCVFLEGVSSSDRSRLDCRHDGFRGTSTSPGTTPQLPEAPDTVLYYSAVCFPDEYDWQQDSAYGSVGFELLFYQDDTPVLQLISGPDACFVPDPDRHHILNGALYTERMSGNQTRIGRNGLELFRFSGREYLVGLVVEGDVLFTLSRKASGEGFSFRRDGVILLERDEGVPYGSLSDPSCGPGGALCRDGRDILFCFRSGKSGAQQHFLVRNGVEEQLAEIPESRKVLDIKVMDGKAHILYEQFLRSLLLDGRIWPEGGSYAVSGRFSNGAGSSYSGIIPSDWGNPVRICLEEAVLYHDAEADYAVCSDSAGTVSVYGPAGVERSGLPCHFFTPACAAVAGGKLLLALTPRDAKLHPLLCFGKRQQEVPLHGYISSVGVELKPKS